MHAAAIEAANTNSVLLTGTIGSGKTYILNKVCGTSFASNMCAESCTREIQEGKACRSGIRVLDTPGFYSTKDSAGHSEKQRTALEQNALSGVYIVVKFGRSDEMAETVNKIMDFVGDDVRIIITHCDFLCQADSGVDMEPITLRLSSLVDVDLPFILPIGKHTAGHEIEDFFFSTLHAPLQHELTELQLASVHDQCVGARRFNKAMQEVHAKIQAASEACQEMSDSKCADERDAAIWQTRNATKCMVDKELSRIRQEARELTIEQKYLLDQNMARAVSLPLEDFLRTTFFTEFHKQSTSPKLEVHFVPDSKSSGWCVLFTVGKNWRHITAELVAEELYTAKQREKEDTQQFADTTFPPCSKKRKPIPTGMSCSLAVASSNAGRSQIPNHTDRTVGMSDKARRVPENNIPPTNSATNKRRKFHHNNWLWVGWCLCGLLVWIKRMATDDGNSVSDT